MKPPLKPLRQPIPVGMTEATADALDQSDRSLVDSRQAIPGIVETRPSGPAVIAWEAGWISPQNLKPSSKSG
jgi:hypothetical protein